MESIKRIIVVPVYNEAGTVKKVIDSILNHIDEHTKLILVQDGSDDGTEDILLELQRTEFFKNHNIDLINHNKNQGYGKALISGFKKSIEYQNANYIVTMDCDEQHQPEDLEKFFNFRHVDILSGSRYLQEVEKGLIAPADRVEINKKLTEKYKEIAANIFHEEWKITDTFCGMKRYDSSFIKSFLKTIPSTDHYDSCMGYGFPMIVWNFYLHWLRFQKKSLNTSFDEVAIPKIYVSNDRTFGNDLDFPRKRYRYYLNCMKVKFDE
ncbi:MAG: glycosyltransferase family 2 protein [Spirochaetia bacterium]|nr:glycosyltransferase family 2 protein [Spirochaetia bacterium]